METLVNLAQEEDVSRRLAGHQVVAAVEKEECDGPSDAGNHGRKN